MITKQTLFGTNEGTLTLMAREVPIQPLWMHQLGLFDFKPTRVTALHHYSWENNNNCFGLTIATGMNEYGHCIFFVVSLDENTPVDKDILGELVNENDLLLAYKNHRLATAETTK